MATYKEVNAMSRSNRLLKPSSLLFSAKVHGDDFCVRVTDWETDTLTIVDGHHVYRHYYVSDTDRLILFCQDNGIKVYDCRVSHGYRPVLPHIFR